MKEQNNVYVFFFWHCTVHVSQSALLIQKLVDNTKHMYVHPLNLVSRAEHRPDRRPELAGEQPEDDGTHVLSIPSRFKILILV